MISFVQMTENNQGLPDGSKVKDLFCLFRITNETGKTGISRN